MNEERMQMITNVIIDRINQFFTASAFGNFLPNDIACPTPEEVTDGLNWLDEGDDGSGIIKAIIALKRPLGGEEKTVIIIVTLPIAGLGDKTAQLFKVELTIPDYPKPGQKDTISFSRHQEKMSVETSGETGELFDVAR